MSNPKKVPDRWKSYLLGGAEYTEVDEFPIIDVATISEKVPQNIVPFDKIETIHKDDRKKYFVCFYCQDSAFECVWKNPKKYINVFLDYAGIIGFDFSVHYDMPTWQQKYQMAINLVLTYFYGRLEWIKVIPNIRYGLAEYADEFLKAFPKRTLISIGTYGFIKTKEEQKPWIAFLEKVISVLNPKGIIVYGPHPNKIFHQFENRTKFYYYNSWTKSFFDKRKEKNK